MNIFQVMRVRTADHIAGGEIRMLPPDSMEVLKVMKFRAGKGALRRHKPQV